MTAVKTAPKVTRSRAKATPAKAKSSRPAGRPATGPAKATLDFAAKVVKLRDKDQLPWAEVAAKLDVPYDHNGSSRLRRAYTLGKGATVGVRAKATAKKAAKSPAKATPKATAKRTPSQIGRTRKRGAAK